MFLEELPALTFIDNNYSIIQSGLMIQLILVSAFIFIFCTEVFSQWNSNPSENTMVVIDTSDPINISSITDFRNGAFVFWEDKKNDGKSDIYFTHVDGTGIVNLEPEGKKISNLNGVKTNPAASENLPNTAIILWKDFSQNSTGELFAQRVDNLGNIFWSEDGLQLTNAGNLIFEYSVTSDDSGNVYIIYLLKDKKTDEYLIKSNKINVDGKFLYNNKNGIVIHKSFKRKSLPSIIPDNNGGAFVFWLESINGKGILNSLYINTLGKYVWGKNPRVISDSSQNVITYSAAKNKSSIYLAWQTYGKDKDIYHQLINISGKLKWNAGGQLATNLEGNQSNPQVVCSDSLYTLSWTHELDNDRNVFIQKFNPAGFSIWENDVPVIDLKGDQFGQKIINDEKGGNISVWVDRRIPLNRANIYAQKIDYSGEIQWDSTSLEVGTFDNSEKSYLSIIPDNKGGAIVIFKDKREGNCGIYAQKIFNTGTYVSQILGFNTELFSDSVKISWYCANENKNMTYEIERTSQHDTLENNWKLISSVFSEGGKAKYYEYMDKPAATGTIYYRLIQKDIAGFYQESEISRINYFEYNQDIIVAQNNPNPFSDSTVISFFLPFEDDVKIEFFNSQIVTLSEVEQLFPAGENKITFHANGAAIGIYFYRVTIGSFVDVKKMVIVNK